MNQIYVAITSQNEYVYHGEEAKAQQKAEKSSGKVIRNASDLNELTTGQLVALYNKVAGKDIKKFESLAKGKGRVWKFLCPKNTAIAARKTKEAKVSKEAKVPKEAKVKTKAKTKVSKTTPKTKVASKPRGKTIGGLIRDCIAKGLDAEKTLAKVKQAFPNSQTTKNCYAYYRSKMKREGALLA